MLTVATILDQFSEECFSPEINNIPMLPTDYLARLRKSGHIDFVLVESAWRGPKNSWSHLLVNNKKHPIPEGYSIVKKIMKECHSRKIPTVFWSKEDPVHFNHFILTAGLFDYVATTAEECIPLYKKKLKHSNVFVLPFAAQQDIHNPIPVSERTYNVCFAGACRNKQYPARKNAMDLILLPAIPYGLHIYDRARAGASGEEFPEIYKKCILGGIPYKEMLKKYKEYKVFLNINSIDNSKTMFSRRVFELLACGTPVISSYSPGISKMLPEVLISTDKQQTVKYLNLLLTNRDVWDKTSKEGIKRVFNEHTYSHRLLTICSKLKIPSPKYLLDRISLCKNLISS